MDRELFGTTSFSKENFPGYRCPRCHSHLALEDFSEEDNAETQRDQRDPDFDADWVVRGFRAGLRCKSDRCGERVLCVGTGAVDTIHDQSGEGWDVAYVDRLTPQFFLPALEVFELPPTTPREVRDSVLASFKLLFLSSGSTLNEVRNALEFLMDHLKVPRADGERSLSLHGRVQRMPAQYAQYRDQLLAVKWLGNAGTHAHPTRRSDVLDAYEILHHVLDGMFSDRVARVGLLVDKINQRKAPIE